LNNDLSSGILNGHYELGRRPRQPAYPGKVECDSKCGSVMSNQAGRVDPPKTEGFLFLKSVINATTIKAYQDTEYRVQSDKPFTLQIGTLNDPLLVIHKLYRVECSALITAWNPFSQILSETENNIRQLQLKNELGRRGLKYLPGIGQHPSNNWPGEESFLVLGLNLQEAKKLGEHFGQNAIVWCGADGIPELILLM
jgi:hypothetical protein